MKKQVLFIFLSFILFTQLANGQCAMCTATAEEALRNGSSATASLNKGVLYLFVTPYLLAATIGFFWWKARKKVQTETL